MIYEAPSGSPRPALEDGGGTFEAVEIRKMGGAAPALW